MPQLQKTTVVPPGNPTSVLNEKIIKMIVVTNDSEFVEKADNLAINAPTAIQRKVIWYKQPDWQQLKQMFAELPYNKVDIKAFSVSTKNKIADVITVNEQADYMRIDEAYTKAGLAEFN